MQAVLGASGRVPDGTPVIRGYDFNDGNDLDSVMASMFSTGFQATSLGQGIREINRMVCRFAVHSTLRWKPHGSAGTQPVLLVSGLRSLAAYSAFSCRIVGMAGA